MYGAKYVWIILGNYSPKWWEVTDDVHCSPYQLRTALQYHFSTDLLTLSNQTTETVSGLVSVNRQKIHAVFKIYYEFY